MELGIAASVAGLISLGIQVTQSLVDFYTTYKHRDTDLARITENLDDLLGIFRSLEVAIEARKFRADDQELLQSINEKIQKCDEVIKELRDECAKFQQDSAHDIKGKVKVAGRRVAYPFRKSTLQKLEEDIGEIFEILSFALDILQLKDHESTRRELSEQRSFLELINASHISSEIRGWLSAPDATVNHNAACAKHHTSTGMWFIKGDNFNSWLTKPNSFLWITGFAGCGKSVLVSTAIQRVFRAKQQERNVGIAFFYFDFNDTTKQSDIGMLRTLLLQLSTQLEDCKKDLEQLYQSYLPGTPPVPALIAYLHRNVQRFRNTYILLDALDESPRNYEREGILTVLKKMRGWNWPGLHLLVSSRDHLDIRKSLEPSCDQEVIMKNTEIGRDISSFVAYQLNIDSDLQKWKARHSEIEAVLTERANGVFRYVEFQFKALKKARNLNHLKACLRSLPRGLEATYEQLLCNIDETYTDDVRRILTMLCFSSRPLTVAELIHAHAVELGDEPPYLDYEGRLLDMDGLHDICLGLIEFVRDENVQTQGIPTVHIAHLSVQEYLVSDRIRNGKAAVFALQRGPANTEIARICLVSLLEPGLSSGRLTKRKLIDFPLAPFAARHWFDHYTNSQDGKFDVQKLAVKLFTSKEGSFQTWIRLYDVDQPKRGIRHQPEVDLSWLLLPPRHKHALFKMASPLYYASLLGCDWVLHDTIAIGLSDTCSVLDVVNAKGGKFGNALQAAISQGHENVMRMLLDHGADVNAQGGHYGNALQAASYEGHERVVRMLLDHGADVNAQGGHHGNALQAASSQGHGSVVRMLLDHGADVNAQGGHYGNALQAASYEGHERVVQMLLNQDDVNVNAQGGHYGNALQAASYEGHERVVWMLDHGADVIDRGRHYDNALQAASSQGHGSVVQMLLDHGADVNAQGGHYGNALHLASFEGHEGVVQILLNQNDVNVNAQGGHYGNALQAASSQGHENVVRMLLNHGADVNAQGGLYCTVYEVASSSSEIEQMLLDLGERNLYGSALHVASFEGHEGVVQILLHQDHIDVNSQGDFGSALQAASFQGHENVVRMLLDHGADVNSEGLYGNALHAASSRGHENVVRVLLDHGADGR